MKSAHQWKLELWGYGAKKEKDIKAIQDDARAEPLETIRQIQDLLWLADEDDLVAGVKFLTGRDDALVRITGEITEYLSAGGLFNPEMMEHEKVRDLLIRVRDL